MDGGTRTGPRPVSDLSDEEASELNVTLRQMKGWQVESRRGEGGRGCVGGAEGALRLPPSPKGQTQTHACTLSQRSRAGATRNISNVAFVEV